MSLWGGPRSSLARLVATRAAAFPEQPAYTFLSDGEAEAAELTCGELERRARAVAAELSSRCARGDRALLLFPAGLDFIVAFFGCLFAGVVAVPAYPPRPRRDQTRLRALAADSEPRVVLTTSVLLGEIQKLAAEIPALASASWLALEDVPDREIEGEIREPEPDELAFLQYTSGSTALPKGVMVSHANLLHNQRMISAAFEQDESSVVVGWLPLYHDMGLIGNVLQPLYCGGRCVLMSPMAFLQRPGRWLRAISRYRATTSGGPNFAYELCVQKVGEEERRDLDLSSWRVAFNGAEPVRAQTLRRFAEAFAPQGFRREAFYPCYGLAEATLFVTGGKVGEAPRIAAIDAAALERHEVISAEPDSPAAQPQVGSGRPWLDQQVVVVDPETAVACAPGRVGEIWVSGPSVALGYWRQPEATERDFQAKLAAPDKSAPSPRTFLRTGDLGFLLDGELYVTGRLKDLIILRGRNLYPQDIERTAEGSHPALRPGCGAAFSVDEGGEERLVVACEVERHFGGTVEEIAGAVRRAVAEEHEAQVRTVVLLRAGTLPRTTSGKVQRHRCGALYRAGELDEVGRIRIAGLADTAAVSQTAGAPASREVALALPVAERASYVEERLRTISASLLGVAPDGIEAARPLTELGLDSLGAISWKHAVEAELGASPSLAELLSGLSLAEAGLQIVASLSAQPAAAVRAELLEGLPTEAEAPLSHGQRSLWLLHRLAPQSAAYNLAGVARLLRPVDAGLLERVFQGLVDRHPALRTTYAAGPDGPVQRVHERLPAAFHVEDAALWSTEHLGRRLREEAFRPFDLEHGPLLRVALFTGGEAGPGRLLVSLHHIAADLASVSVLARELGLGHAGAALLDTPSPALQPAGFARWQERLLAGPEGERLLGFWREQLAGTAPLELPTDRPRPPLASFAGGVRRARLSAERTQALHALARAQGATLFMALLAGFDLLLSRSSGQADLVVGCPSTGRAPDLLGDRLGGTVGYFVNPLPLRVSLEGDLPVAQVLARVRAAALAAFAHQDLPLGLMAERLATADRDSDPSRPPFFRTLLVLQQAPSSDLAGLAAFALGQGGGRLDLGGLELESVTLDSPAAQLDLTLTVAELGSELGLALQFDSDLFDAVTAERLLEQLGHLLAGMATDPAARASSLELLGEAARWQVLGEWNATAAPFPHGAGLHQLFETQAAATPAAVAVVGEGERWTYAELDRRAERLAGRLRGLGVGPEVRVGVLCRRTPDVVAALLAVLKAGGAYVPLDPAYPRKRLTFQTADSGAAVLVAHPGLADLVPGFSGAVVELAAGWHELEAGASEPGPVAADPEQLAYVIYTSGSTGTPKGVAIRHGSAVARVSWGREAYRREHLAGVLAATSICFDLSVFELFVPLAAGGSVVLAEDALALAGLPAAGEVTLINTVPSAMAELVRAGAVPQSVRVVNLAGEPLHRGLANEIQALPWIVELHNLYGPSEDTTYSTGSRVARDEDEPGIGRPLPNSRAYVLGPFLEPVPAGVAGELWLGGEGLARGYLQRPDLTADRFRPDPFAVAQEGGGRLYRTGDRVRRRTSGELEFLGRLDHQVKLRGYRIELEEIQAALALHPEVAEAVVAAPASVAGERCLVAYFAPRLGSDPRPGELQSYLASRLPGPMVPSLWVRLSQLPRTASGKVDRKALPEPQPAVEAAVPALPRTPLEELLAGVWQEVLGVAAVSRDQSFFALGGHSLLAAQVASRVRGLLGVELPLRALFESPTLEELAARVERARAEGGPAAAVPPLVRVPREEPVGPLSPAQERLWFLDRLEPGSPAYNVAQAVRIRGPLDVAALKGSLVAVAGRHESLRTTFRAGDPEPVQVVAPAVPLALPQDDLSGLPADRIAAMVEQIAVREARAPFDLGQGPLLRLRLLRLGEEEHVLLLTLHHTVTDGWSMGVLVREVAALYPALAQGQAASLPELPLQYLDYAAWQRDLLAAGTLAPQIDFWRERLRGVPALLDLPVDRPRPAQRSSRGASLPVSMPEGLAAHLRELGRREGLTPFMLLLTGFAGLLARATRRDDVVVGTPVAGRNRVELEPLIGLFLNTLPVRLDLSGDPDFLAAARRVREATLAAHAHQEVPFERLVDEIAPARSLAYAPLVQVMLVLQPVAPAAELPGLDVAVTEVDTGATKLDLTLSLADDGRRFAGRLTYSSELFDAPTLVRLLEHFQALLAAAVARPEAGRLAELPVLSEAERAQLLQEWNDTRETAEEPAPVHHQIAQWARRAPERPALVWEGLEITYGELESRANRLAQHLLRLGVRAGELMALSFERSPDMAVALLGTLKTGAAYVPLDPEWPEARRAALLADSGAALVLDPTSLAAALAGEAEATDPQVLIPAESLAYVIYTSGSTGHPKGVGIGHRQLARYVRAVVERLDLAASASFAMVSTFAADLGNTVLFPALVTGGCLHLLSPRRATDAGAFAEYLQRHPIDCLKIVPSHLAALQTVERPERALPRRHLLLGGEATTRGFADLLQSRAPGCRIFNHYGPTETTVGVATSLHRPGTSEPASAVLPLGRPLPGAEIHLLDAAFQPVPIGVPGELYIGGAGVAVGYLRRPDLTAERFLPNPFPGAGVRLYRSGDLARRRPDGQLEFLGRADQQVKIRGFRVEPAEVAAVLRQHPAVAEAEVVARPHPAGDLRLVAYVVPAPGENGGEESLHAFLGTRLPEYLLPAVVVKLDRLPLTVNGKVDRRALPEPEWAQTSALRAPGSPTEELLAGLWCEVLGAREVGANDDFFALGGHSLRAIQLQSRVRNAFGVELPLKALFEAPTVAGLAAQIDAARRGSAAVPPPIRPRGAEMASPLSFAQERLWFLDQLEPGNPAYNVPLARRLRGRVPVAALAAALAGVAQRHEALRATFTGAAGRPVQTIGAEPRFPLSVVDLTALPAPARQAEADCQATEEARRPFDLAAGPLCRAALFQIEPEEQLLLLGLHHIVFDGWSAGLLLDELGTRLAGGLAEPLPVQYADFALWQREWLASGALDAQLAFWRERLAGAPAALDLPADQPRPAVQTFRGGAEPMRLPSELVHGLRALGQRLGATLFMTLLAGWGTVLHRWSGAAEVMVGTPVSNRRRPELEPLIGLFVNTLPLRLDLSGDPSFAEMLARTRALALAAYDHQDVPFERLVEAVGAGRDLARSPLFQVMLALGGDDVPALRLPEGGTAEPVPLHNATAKLELLLALSGTDGGLTGGLEFNRDLFDAATARRVTQQLARLLAAAAADPEARIGDLPFLTTAEERQILETWNATAAPFPRDLGLHELFEAQAARTPEATALIHGDERLSYGELDAWSDLLARRLVRLGVGPETLVGVFCGRNPGLIAAALAVLKAGGAYLPLDPAYPADRLAFLLADAGAPLVLVEPGLATAVPPFAGTLVPVDREPDGAGEGERPRGFLDPGQTAYAIYTSGSTGVPKGVLIRHSAAVARMTWALAAYPREVLAGVLAATSLCFDLSVFEIFVPLSAGGTVVLADDALALPALPAASAVTLVNTVPSAIAALVRTGGLPRSLRVVNLAGEPLRRDLVERIYAQGVEAVYNLYGPSEDTTYSTGARIVAGDPREPEIGRPLPNTRVYVLDAGFRPVPVGAPGELWIGGEGVARGYLRRPDLTADRFRPDPFGPPSGRLYRTGDLARWRPDGALDYLGRRDHQVKVRGFRIELGEVEAALLRHPRVAEAVVGVRQVAGEPVLVAWFAARGEVAAAELRGSLAAGLPAFMVPSFFVSLPALPLLPNGKVDRSRLPEPRIERGEEEREGPKTATEEILAGILAEVLAIESVRREDDFFELGGHSLQGVRVVSRVREVLGVELPVRWLFEAPRVAALAARIEAARSGPRTPVPPLVRRHHEGLRPLSYAQARLWFLAQLAPDNPFYNMHSVLRLAGQLDLAALLHSYEEILRRHEVLRTTYPAVAGEPVQRVEERGAELPVVDLSALPEQARKVVAEELATAFGRRPFDLARDLPLRLALLRLSDGESHLLVNVHHIASDGWSHAQLHRELLALYDASAQGLQSPLPELALQYSDYALWQRERLSGEGLDELLAYWKGRLEGAPTVLDLPTDRPRPAEESFSGADLEVEIDAALASRVREAGRRFGATTFMTALAAWNALLARYTGRQDIVVGTATANRGSRELEDLIGFFVNVLALRTDLYGPPTFTEALARVREVTLGAYDHQDLPFERLVDELRIERTLSNNPLCQVLLVFQNLPWSHAGTRVHGLTVEPLAGGWTHTGAAKFDLILVLWEAAEGRLGGHLQYNSDLFEGATIARLWGHFETLLAAAVEDPETRLPDLPLLSAAERHQLLDEWGLPRLGTPRAPCLHEVFSQVAAAHPGAPAVTFEGRSWTYGELDRQSNRLAHALRSLGVGPEVLVGIVLERSFELVVAALGVLKAGGGYVPLDPTYPKERLAWLREDAGLSVLLTESRLREVATGGEERPGVRVLCLDDTDLLAGASAAALPSTAVPEDVAYVIYTSGSTGRPKGVQVTHGNVLQLMTATEPDFGFGTDDVWTLFHSFSFDFSVWELWGALLYGGRLVVVPYWVSRSPDDFHCLLAEEGVTVLNQTPSAFRQLIEADRNAAESLALRWVVFGGEALDFEGLRPWFEKHGDDRPQLINMYGITETTVHVTFRRVVFADLPSQGGAARGSGIGRPLTHLSAYVLDSSLQPLPAGIPGELCVGGGGVARGYLGRPELTAQRFVPDAWSGIPGGRLYRSGDLAMRSAAGELVHLGRIDHQVKIRGFRIELGEIEAVLRQGPQVREAIALVRQDDSEPQLVAYVVLDAEPDLAAADHSEGGVAEQVAQWEQVFDSTYSRQTAAEETAPQAAAVDPTFDIRGWDSSYTGEPIPAEEMREWVEGTVERIGAQRPRRLLEIGSGTGLLLFRIAPQTESYVGWDFSEVALGAVGRHLATLPGLGHVRLEQRAAHEFQGVTPGSVDAVVLNSVVQYFPSVEYLLTVLEQAVAAIAPGGFLFVGDVRSLPLLEAFHASVDFERAPDNLPLAVWRERVRQRARGDEELVLAPGFFHALVHHLPALSGVEILPRRGRFYNELTRFRYDVILRVGAAPAAPQPAWLDWETEGLDLASIENRLADPGRPALAIRQIPNARLAREVAMLRELAQNPEEATVGSLRVSLEEKALAVGGVDPEDLWRLAAEHGYELRLSWADANAEGKLDALFLPAEQAQEHAWPVFPGGEERPRPWRAYASHPLRARLLRQALPRLQDFVRERLPEHMLPAAYVLLDALPLTAHGKVDRRALPAPDRLRPEVGASFEAPVSALETALAEVWSEILGVGRVGLHDPFFDLGGDSIKAVRLVSRVNERLSVQLKVRDAFRYQSVAEMAAYLASSAGADPSEEERAVGREAISRFQRALLGDPGQRARLPKGYEDVYPLSGIERGMIFHSLLTPDEPVYYDQILYLFEIGDLDRFYRGIELLVDRHSIFRSRYYLEPFAEPLKVVMSQVEVVRDIEDLTHLDKGEQRRWVQAYSANDLATRPSFAGDLLWRLKLFRLEGDLHCIVWSFHHAMLDGWSNATFWVELDELYGRADLYDLDVLPRLASDYRDYVEISLGRQKSSQAESFWRSHLEGHARNQLPFSRAKTRGEEGGMRGINRTLEDDLFDRLRSVALAHSLSLQSLLVSAYLEVLRVTIGEDDLVTGIVTHDRPGIPDGDRIVGCFLNSVPLRVDMAQVADLETLARRVHHLLNEQKRHQLPLVDIAAAVGGRAAQGNPFFDTLINFTNFHVMHGAANHLRYRWADALPDEYRFTSHLMTNTLFDLEVAATTRGKMTAGIKYSPRHFDAADVERAASLYVRALERLASGLQGRLSAEELLSAEERQEILVRFNDTATPFEEDRGLYPLPQPGELPAALAGRPAVACAGRILSYAELDLRARRLAASLRARGVQPGDRVGIICPRSVDLAVAALAILAVDAAYIPMEPDYPPARKGYIAQTSGLSRIVADRLYEIDPPVPAEDVLVISEVEGDSGILNDPGRATGPDDLAYTIYTSGSTGRPKGVMIRHRPAANLNQWVNREFAVGPGDILLMVSSICFDLSVYDLFGGLSAGAKIVIAEIEDLRDPSRLARLIETERITFWNSVPSTLASLTQYLEEAEPGYRLASLRTVFLSGDWIPLALPDKVRRFFPAARVISLGGATEATVWSNFYPVREMLPSWASIPYGRPLANSSFYILDRRLDAVPAGVVGELYIGGVGLAAGYAADPVKTAGAFLPDRFAAPAGSRMYRTGDLGRMMADGNIEFLGRVDHQVKIRGFRVELGEIETQLLLHPEVRAAAVVARDDRADGKYLCAYIVSPGGVGAAELRAHLAEALPEYMIPTVYVPLAALPLSPNGKLDRRALPAPEVTGLGASTVYSPPADALESTLVGIWEEILGVSGIGTRHDFFELGGHSLSAVHVVTRVRRELQLDLPLRALFDAPTVAGLAAALRELAGERPSPALAGAPFGATAEAAGGPLPLSFTQERFWFLQQLNPDSAAFNMKVSVRLSGRLDEAALRASFAAVLQRHPVLRANFRSAAGKPFQILSADLPEVPLVDLSALAPAVRAEVSQQLATESADRPFDLERDRLLRVEVLRLGEREHVVVLTLHHIVGDGWSIGILCRELAEFYAAFSQGRAAALPDLPVHYWDYARRQRQDLAAERYDRQLAYWRRRLAGDLPVLELPMQKERPVHPTFHGAARRLQLPGELSAALQRLSQQQGATLFMTLLAAFQTLLHLYTGQEDLLVGTNTANREDGDLTGVVGAFVNNLVLRTDLAGNPTFLELLARVRATALEAYAHQDVPFELVLEKVRPRREAGYASLFQVMFVFQNFPFQVGEVPGLAMSAVDLELRTANFDLVMMLTEREGIVTGSLIYDTALFSAASVDRMADHFERLLQAVVTDPGRKIQGLDLAERAEALEVANAFSGDF